MIIHRLEMYNFRQYIGKQTIDFSIDPEKNVTVLIGVNTSGKTTIVRAFEWCLYGKNNFEDPVLLNSEVKDNMTEGEGQDVYVTLSFEHNDKIYSLTRLYKYICNKRTIDDNKIKVELNKKPEEKISLEYLQQDGQTKTPIDISFIKESMNRILPEDLSDYFFFGGERISGIANRDDLSKAVRGLMGLEILENARTHLSHVLKNLNSEIDTSGDINAQKAQDSLNTFEEQKKQLEDKRKNYNAQMQYWKDQENEFSAALKNSNIEQVKNAREEMDRLEGIIKNEKNKLARAKSDIVKRFNNRSYAYFGMPIIHKTLELFEKMQEENKNIECVPDMEQGAIDYLIKRGYCLCGTHLDKGTAPYFKILEERKILPPEYIGTAIQSYKAAAEGYLAGTENFSDDIKNKYTEIREIHRQIGMLEDRIAKQSELIVDDTDAKKIEENRKQAHIRYEDAKSDYDSCNIEVGICESKIEDCRKIITQYASNSKENARISRYIMYSEKVLEFFNKSYEDKENLVRNELQKRVNNNFSKMYHGERSILIDEKYRVKYSDITTEESDGLRAVKSFAFISSLVSMAKDKILDDSDMKLGQDYPLVMDAPFSNVDEIHIDNICKILPNTANQVIMAVMQKDWEYASKNLQQRVGKSYDIEKDIDANGKEIDTSTHIRLR